VFPELEHTALIRELHVYGRVVAVGGEDSDATQVHSVQQVTVLSVM
jgi:histone acetyltransferase (RNA polymerase elongator complex component)